MNSNTYVELTIRMLFKSITYSKYQYTYILLLHYELGVQCYIMESSRGYFLANDIFIAALGVILNPWRASLAAADCASFSNSTKAMS